jgi:alpha-tubulin suppressor-like RCC1 family protein
LYLPGRVSSVASGTSHTLALLDDGRLFGWGNNSGGQLALGDCGARTTPTLVPLSTQETLIDVKCGANFSMAITRAGSLFLWGLNPLTRNTSHPVPIPIPTPSPVTHLTCGWAHFLVLTQDGALYVAGDNNHGCFGLGDNIARSSLTLHPTLNNLAAIGTSATNTFFLTKSGTLLACGYHTYGTVGCPQTEVEIFSPVSILEGVVDVAGGGQHGMAIMEDGGVVSWGWNLFGQVGNNSDQNQKIPVRVHKTRGAEDSTGTEKKIISIGCGWGFSFMMDEDRVIYVWGAPRRGGQNSPQKKPMVYSTCLGAYPRNYGLDWPRIFFWIFLGHVDARSPFSEVPIEVLFHFVKVLA